MNPDEIRAALDRTFDRAVFFHEFAEHLRDYDFFALVENSERVQTWSTGLGSRFMRRPSMATGTGSGSSFSDLEVSVAAVGDSAYTVNHD